MILQDFCKRAKVKINMLTQSEIWDIILGLETAEENISKKQIQEIEIN